MVEDGVSEWMMRKEEGEEGEEGENEENEENEDIDVDAENEENEDMDVDAEKILQQENRNQRIESCLQEIKQNLITQCTKMLAPVQQGKKGAAQMKQVIEMVVTVSG